MKPSQAAVILLAFGLGFLAGFESGLVSQWKLKDMISFASMPVDLVTGAAGLVERLLAVVQLLLWTNMLLLLVVIPLLVLTAGLLVLVALVGPKVCHTLD
jgi:hypothetical protein